MRRIVAPLLCTLGLLAAAPSGADIYSYVDKDGTVRFSNVPDDPRYKLFLKESASGVDKSGEMRAKVRTSVYSRDFRGAPYVNLATLEGRPFQRFVNVAAKTHNVDPALVHAVIAAESGYNPLAVSPKGAIGLMQVMPQTGARYGVKEAQLRSPAANINTGTRYLAWLLQQFDGDVKLALAGYNAGEGAVLKHGGRIPPYAETQAYVPRVLRYYEQFRGGSSLLRTAAR